MDKEKEIWIDDMKEIIAETVGQHTFKKSIARIVAMKLSNAGYRKSEQVRKETAEELLNKIDEQCVGSKLLTNQLRREYGVEVYQ